MSKGLSYTYKGTKGHIVSIATSLPRTGENLLSQGWEDISHPNQAQSGHFTYREKSTGLRIRYDKGVIGAPGFKGKSHYHIMNPNATGNHDLYLDTTGEPTRKNSPKSHILPK